MWYNIKFPLLISKLSRNDDIFILIVRLFRKNELLYETTTISLTITAGMLYTLRCTIEINMLKLRH